jgi:hypothetical protein
MSMIQPTTEADPIIRVDRAEQSVEAPKQRAAARPPRMAIKLAP